VLIGDLESWLPTVWYAVYVFGVANRTLRPGQAAKAGS